MGSLEDIWEAQLDKIIIDMYEAEKNMVFAGILVRERVGKYSSWDFSKEAREARAKRKALREQNKESIEKEALQHAMEKLSEPGIPEATRERILRKLQSH